MIEKIIKYSIQHKLIILLFSIGIIGFGLFSLSNIPIGAVPDVTNNQVQIITTSRNLATEDVEKFLTYPIELEMANLPEVKEIRSVSKFGLSVVTIVFNDKIGTHLPRQLIAEKIKIAEENIPNNFGKPFMGPITTGLGEIYQYIIDVDSSYKNNYNLSDLRTIQDWEIRRKLSGIPGVIEVNTWGGNLKQYEVAIDPSLLRSTKLSLEKVFLALEKNNSIAGGGYIEKTNQTYFIRGEGLTNSLEDIKNIVIENRNGFPIFIKDIAHVGFGSATRFGAVTGNGEGEKVLGQVMMLKGGNSKEVIKAVKERVKQISKTLPPGIKINPFLERTELIDKTTFTIAENLILGCLIVIFVVVLLLGNLRSGLVVASVIPMCLLFALSLMYIFDVDANLMSLGAIDFGIIIDGAVIIVEFIAFQITSKHQEILSLDKKDQQKFIDQLSYSGANKMMHSAIFGQVIIIIVFIPILSLVGIEGKMFRPMALVFCFALIGAMIFCFTYVPVMVSLFIKPSNPNKRNISIRIITFMEKKYEPIITWALQQKKLILSLASVLLIITGIIFSSMGGEFVPTLDEGDFVIQPVLKTGTSLSSTVNTTTQIEKILKKFPEVDQVVSRIGAAEVPTDPMSMEESDIIIKLKPKNQWINADSKDELANKFKEALNEIPGIEYEFTQPIEMRFNELITGVRTDLAIKIFGEDLKILHDKALEIENVITGINGAADIIVEKIAGLPQMTVKYNRQKIAKYGLNIDDLNNIITMGFAGKKAGTIFEGEKSFDLVIRYDKNHHQDIEDIKTSTIELPNGNQLPLSEFAEISYTTGPAKISRENTKRRIVIGVNVRNRDMESVVKDIQKIINQKIQLPTGYEIVYGGQFENLNTAKKRLMIVVPIALVLIFMLLYFAFKSIKEALIIYSAIPLSAVGGVLLLYFRDLPFSISAGVGFIALFGIAVLNGIVLIEEFKELKHNGILDINKRIITGTKNRLRPVLLTASAAALGFLPMAISSSAGAEVQKPLATVVVGGLISATLLTLIVLPILYAIFEKNDTPIKFNQAKSTLTLLLFLISPFIINGQNTILNIDQAVELAIQNNQGLKASALRVYQNEQLINSSIDLNKTGFYYNKDLNNIAPNNIALNVWGISQNFQFPTVYAAQKNVLNQKYLISKDQFTINQQILIKDVKKKYYEIIYWEQMLKNLTFIDSIYASFTYSAKKKYDLGESNYLEVLTAETKTKEIAIFLNQIQENIHKNYILLQQLLQSNINYKVNSDEFIALDFNPIDTLNHPVLNLYKNSILLSNKQLDLEKHKLLPDINTSVFNGVNNGLGRQSYFGFQVGIGVPIYYGSQKSKILASKTEVNILSAESENYKIQLLSNYNALLSDLNQHAAVLKYYETTGKKLSKETIFYANKSYQNGEINFLQYVQLLENAKNIEINFLKSLLLYNNTVLEINYLLY